MAGIEKLNLFSSVVITEVSKVIKTVIPIYKRTAPYKLESRSAIAILVVGIVCPSILIRKTECSQGLNNPEQNPAPIALILFMLPYC